MLARAVPGGGAGVVDDGDEAYGSEEFPGGRVPAYACDGSALPVRSGYIFGALVDFIAFIHFLVDDRVP